MKITSFPPLPPLLQELIRTVLGAGGERLLSSSLPSTLNNLFSGSSLFHTTTKDSLEFRELSI